MFALGVVVLAAAARFCRRTAAVKMGQGVKVASAMATVIRNTGTPAKGMKKGMKKLAGEDDFWGMGEADEECSSPAHQPSAELESAAEVHMRAKEVAIESRDALGLD